MRRLAFALALLAALAVLAGDADAEHFRNAVPIGAGSAPPPSALLADDGVTALTSDSGVRLTSQ